MKKIQQKEQTGGIYLLLGENEFEKEEFVKKLVSDFSSDRTVEVITIPGNEENPVDKFLSYLSSVSLFTQHRVIILKNIDRAITRQEKEKIVKIFKSLKSNTDLVIITSSLSPYKFDKTISSLIEELGTLKTFWKVFEHALPEYVAKLLSGKGIEPKKEVIELLIERNGQNVDAIVDEINYVRNHFPSTSYVRGEEAMDLLLRKSGSSTIFDLLSALLRGDKHKAILTINNILERGEEPFALGSLLYSQIQKIVKVKKFLRSGVSDEEIIKRVGITSFELRNIKKLAKDVDENRIRLLLKFVLDLENFVRSSDETAKLAIIEMRIMQMF